ncbi:hypothetical protein FA15DRAFT_672739 [Coprinopsis marcescibilis]|uniref:Uncharacterized protein n=1 Tax=Coprinopsis marcescibilis TaxID=230819 RepID=A0A5C3KLK6_COPMA|nr:hypothetical protein FA15DRAFT_672739 [Coprinopsis marcescibilis]
MGSAVSSIMQGDKTTAQTKEQLTLLVNACNAKLDKYESDLNSMFIEPESARKKSVVGLRSIRFERGYRVSVKDDIGSGLTEIVNSFFGIFKPSDNATDPPKQAEDENDKPPSEGEHQEEPIAAPPQKKQFGAVGSDNVVEGFKNLVNGALKVFLGTAQAGEEETQKFFIFMRNNAVIRVDIKLWKYSFSSESIMANTQNVVAYIFCTSVVDASTLSLDEFTYLISEYVGDTPGEDIKKYVEELLDLWKNVSTLYDYIKKEGAKKAALESGRLDSVFEGDGSIRPQLPHPGQRHLGNWTVY